MKGQLIETQAGRMFLSEHGDTFVMVRDVHNHAVEREQYAIIRMSDGRDALFCKLCRNLSANPKDAEHRYCACCKLFLDPEQPSGRIRTLGDGAAQEPTRW